MKFQLRKKNFTQSKDLVNEAKNFLGTIDQDYMKKKMAQSCKFFIKAINREEF